MVEGYSLVVGAAMLPGGGTARSLVAALVEMMNKIDEVVHKTLKGARMAIVALVKSC